VVPGRGPTGSGPTGSSPTGRGSPGRGRRWRLAAGLCCLATAAAAIAYPLAWQRRQDAVGASLVKADRSRAGPTGGAPAASCARASGPGVLAIPALHVVAPVEQGLSGSVLAVALGHDPSTPWPGAGVASLIAGHDVGYLSADTRLHPGDTLSYALPCATLHYVVVGHEVTAPGQAVTLPSGGSIVLDSCWPTDALWFTPQRYVVTARYVSTSGPPDRPVAPTPPPRLPTVALPTGLAASQLTLAANWWPMGTLHVAGRPAPSWTASQASLGAEAAGLEVLFGLRHGLETGRTAWLEAFAPGLRVPAWLAGSPGAPLDVTETVDGQTVSGVVLRSMVQTATGPVPFVLTATVRGDALVATSIRAAP